MNKNTRIASRNYGQASGNTNGVGAIVKPQSNLFGQKNSHSVHYQVNHPKTTIQTRSQTSMLALESCPSASKPSYYLN